MDIPFGQSSVKPLAQSEDKKVNGPMGQVVSEMAHARNAEKVSATALKKEMNAAILESAAEVSLSTGDNSLSLLLKTAIENINAELKNVTGQDNAIQAAIDEGLDVSPEATADRIVSLSTAFFSQYLEIHPEMQEEDARSSFVDIIKGGIDKGFEEARDILEGLRVLEGDIATNIDKTYELVQQGLDQFLNNDSDSEVSDLENDEI